MELKIIFYGLFFINLYLGVKNKAGQYIWREDNAKFEYDSSGNYKGSYVICRDITRADKGRGSITKELYVLQ
jgi:hypothetical protein